MTFFFLLLAQSSAPTTTQLPWGDILKYGVTPVLVLALLISGILRVGAQVDKTITEVKTATDARVAAEKARADRAEEKAEESQERERRLFETYQERFLPAIENSRNAVDRALDFVSRAKV